MQLVRTQPQDERVSESRLYQVPGRRTYGASVHFLRYVPNKSREEHMLHGMCHDKTVPEHERVSEPSLTKCQATGHNARQCTFCDTCQTNHGKKTCPNQQCAYCEEYGHDAKRCPEKPTPMCYACGSSTHQTPRSVDCSEHKCATCQGELEPKGHNHKNCPKYCTVCVASGHCRNTNACPNRVCTKCQATGHLARQCTFCDTCQTNRAKNKCPNQQCTYCEEYGHDAKRCPENFSLKSPRL